MVARENKNNAYAKFGATTKSIKVFSEMANYSVTTQRRDFFFFKPRRFFSSGTLCSLPLCYKFVISFHCDNVEQFFLPSL